MNDDYAVVVGIADYDASLGPPLKGPENDAKAFYDWVTTSGGVDPSRAELILSSRYPPAVTAFDRQPGTREIEGALIKLDAVATKNSDDGKGLTVGRRLYVYLSGHGCAPRFEEAALLVANATKKFVYHFTGMPVADWFYLSGYFREIVLIMDCCREAYQKAGMYVPPWVTLTANPNDLALAERFYGLAAPWSRVARETEVTPGVFRGIFTLALLAGLNGAACDATTHRVENGVTVGDVTAASLKGFLYRYMKTFLSTADQADPMVPKEPDIPHPRDPVRSMLFGPPVPVPSYPAVFTVSPASVGAMIQFQRFAADGQPVVVATQPNAPAVFDLPLPANTYFAQITTNGNVRQRSFVIEYQPAGGVNRVDL